MQRFFTKNLFINVSFLAFVSILIYRFVKNIFIGYTKDSWGITEFLINYQGGFVRRGLLGEALLSIYNTTGISPYPIIISTCISAYIVLIIFFVKSIIKQGYPLFFLPFIFFLGNPIINDFWVRKDIILVLLFIAVIYFSNKKNPSSLIIYNLFLILGILIHESIGFFCVPILCLLLSANNDGFNGTSSYFKSFSASIYKLSPSILVFLCVLYFKGSKLVADQIWNSWKTIKFPLNGDSPSQAPAAIDGISWTLKQGLYYTYDTLTRFDFGIYAPLAWLLIIIAIYYVLTNISALSFKIFNYSPNKNFDKLNVSAVLIFQLLSIMPLFLLGWDYGRWVFFWTISCFAIILIIPEEKLASIFPRVLFTISEKINHYLSKYLTSKTIFLLCLIIGFPAFSWDLKSAISSSSAAILLKSISNLLTSLF